MATKFPADYDDAVTLGGPFIDTIPPADPQRNIAAEFRNNMNDAIIAVQTRIGYTDDPSDATIDWGLLNVAGAANQGLRFAGTHAAWPGAIGESGFFIETATGHVAFHEAGDAVNVFTDLIATAGSWDAIYSVDKHLDISVNNDPLVFEQSSTLGYGFEITRSLAAAFTDSPILHIENGSSLDDQPSVLIDGGASNGISKHIAQVTASSAGLMGGTETLIGIKSIVEEAAADAAGAELVAFRSTVGGVAGAGTTVGFDADATLDFGLRSASTGLFELDTATTYGNLGLGIIDANPGIGAPFIVAAGTLAVPTLRFKVATTGQTEITANDVNYALRAVQSDSSGDIFELRGFDAGNARWLMQYNGDTLHRINAASATNAYELWMQSAGGLTVAEPLNGLTVNIGGDATDVAVPVVGVDLVFGKLGGTYDSVALNISGDWDHGIWSTSQIVAELNSTDTCLVAAQDSTGLLIDLISGTVAAGTSVWSLDPDGTATHLTAAATGNFTAYDLTTSSDGLAAGITVRGQHVKVTGNAGDTGVEIRGLDLEFTDAGTSTSYGIYINSDWDQGLYSAAVCEIEVPAGSLDVLRLSRGDYGNHIYSVGFGASGGSWTLDSNSRVSQAVQLGTGFSGAFNGHLITCQSNAPGAAEVVAGLEIDNSLNAANHATSVHYGIKLRDCTNAGSGQSVGLDVGENYTLAISTESPVKHITENQQTVDIDCTVTDIAGDIEGVTVDMARTVALTQDDKSVYGVVSTVYSHVDDEAPVTVSPHASFRAEFSGTLPPVPQVLEVPKYGFSAGSGFLAGIHSESSLWVEGEPAFSGAPLVYFGYTAATPYSPIETLLRIANGPITASTPLFNINSGGETVFRCVSPTFGAGVRNYAVNINSNDTDVDLLKLFDDVNDKDRLVVVLDGGTTISGAGTTLFTLRDEPNDEPRLICNIEGDVIFYSGASAANTLLTLDNSTYIGAGSQDLPFTNYVGFSAADYTKNISTVRGYTTEIVGPGSSNSGAVDGWAFAEVMVKIEVNGVEYWVATYTPDPVTP